MTVDTRQLRNCLGHFATGIAVITYEPPDSGGRPQGVTLNTFTAVSVDPPLVLVSLAGERRAIEGNPFTVNVLREKQDTLALHFAGHAMPAPVRWAPRNGLLAPRLLDVLAYFACTPWQRHDAGDHTLYLGKVEEYAYFGGDPLVFFQGRFAGLGPEAEREPWIGSLDDPELGWLLPAQ